MVLLSAIKNDGVNVIDFVGLTLMTSNEKS